MSQPDGATLQQDREREELKRSIKASKKKGGNERGGGTAQLGDRGEVFEYSPSVLNNFVEQVQSPTIVEQVRGLGKQSSFLENQSKLALQKRVIQKEDNKLRFIN